MKKNIFLLFLSCIGLSNCGSASTMTFSGNETLIVNNYKVIQHGLFTFLVFINEDEVKELVYGYSIDIKNKKVTCFKNSENIYNIQDKKDYLESFRFQTSEKFKHFQADTWREKYYLCFSKDFLEKTNDEKLDLLDELSKK